VLGQQFQDIEKVIGPLSVAVIVLIVAAYIYRQLTWRTRHPAHLAVTPEQTDTN
jgi:hypothetical protein